MLWVFSTIGRAWYGCCTIVASTFLISCDRGKEAGHSLAFFMASWPYLRLFTKQRTRREGTLRAPCSSFEDARERRNHCAKRRMGEPLKPKGGCNMQSLKLEGV